jgi:MFS family permease
VAPEPVTVTRRPRLGGAYWRLWGATAISSSGDGLLAVALPLLALTLTRNPLAIAGVAVAQKASLALAALPAGVMIDRAQRRTVMLACNVVSGLVLVTLVLGMTLGMADLVMVYVVAAILAVCDVTYTLALQASVPEVIGAPEHLGTANARLQGVDGAGEQFAGPALGGILFAIARRVPFLADGVSFFLAALLIRVSIPHHKDPLLHAGGHLVADGAAGGGPVPAAAPAEWDGQYRHAAGWTADFRAGLRVFGRQKTLKLLAATLASLSFSNGVVLALLVLYGERSLHLGSTGYGIFVGASSTLGIIGSFSGGAVQRRLGAARAIVGGTALAALSYLGLAYTHLPVLAVFVFGLNDVGLSIVNVGSVTTRQRLIPRQLYGRVGSVHRLIVGGAAPLGALFGGLVASVSSVKDAFLLAGGLELVMLAYLAPALLRNLGAPEGPHTA